MAELVSNSQRPAPSEASDFAEYWRIVVGNLRTILAITAVGTLLSSIYFSTRPNLYTATVQILVERARPTQQASSQAIFMPNYRSEDDYYGTQIAILTGRKIQEKVVKKFQIDPLKEKYRTRATRLRATRIIAFSVTHKNPKMAADIANQFAEFFVQENANEDLYVTEQILKLIPEKMDLDEKQTAEGTSEFNKKEYVESFASVMEDPVVQKMRTEKIELGAKLNEYSQRYKPLHPVMAELTERLKYVDNEIKDRTSKIVTNLRAGLSGKIKINNVRILELASPPLKPSEPKRVRGVAIITFMLLISSVWLIVFREILNEKVRTEKDLPPMIDVPFLGYLPVARELLRNKKNSRQAGKNVSLVDAIVHNSVLADSVAGLRTHILFSMPYEKSKRIMFTSSIPEEGKSTAATLFALSLVMLKRKILLIDGDLRRPSLHSYLGLKNEKGLGDFLVGECAIEEIIRSVPGSDLKLITSGGKMENAAEFLASERFGLLMNTASENFDRIVIDVPPSLFIADGLIIAKHVHSGVLVCGSGMVNRKTIQAVIDKFHVVNHAFIGLVINHADFEKEGYRYQYYRNYKNYYSR